MPALLSAIAYGDYVSPVKLIVYTAFFFLWIPLVNWVHSDAQAVRTKFVFWTSVMALSGAVSLIVWLLAPFFLIGMLIYIIAVGAVIIAFVMHRNSLVADFEKILTPSHIKGLLVNEEKKMSKMTMGMKFITANKNEVPLPAPKSTEAYAFQTACEIFEDATWRRATDIILMPAQDEYKVSYTIDGVSTKQPGRDREEMEYFINYIKQIADLDVKEKRKPQTGRMYVESQGQRTAWDINTAGSTAGEQVKIVKFENAGVMKLDALGLDDDQVEKLKSLREKSSGIFITSGPPKSGTSTTFYAMMNNHDPFMNDINTLEREVTATLDNVTQHTYSMNDSSASSYAEKLQSMIRMGPSIIGAADCDDAEAAKLATTAAAKQNRLVHVNIEATSAIKALGKWIKFTGDKDMVIDSLLGLSNQRLARKLCRECRQSYKPNPKLLKKFNIPPKNIKVFYRPGEIEYDKHGKPIVCEKCQGTGYYGRIGIFETVVVDDELRKNLKQAKTMKDIALCFSKAKVINIQQRAIKKVIDGTTSINEVIKELSNKDSKKSKAKAKAASKPKASGN